MNIHSDSTTFESLAMPLFDSLYRYARCLADDRAEAEDLVQETYLKGLRGFLSFTPGTNFRAWMFRILRNTFLTSRTGLERRSTSQESEEGFEEQAISHDTPETAMIRRGNMEMVQEAISRLPDHFREVLLLADIEEMKYQEVADTLDIPIGTVMSRLARARGLVRQHILEIVGAKQTVGARS